jgi:hypothetical protein
VGSGAFHGDAVDKRYCRWVKPDKFTKIGKYLRKYGGFPYLHDILEIISLNHEKSEKPK